MKKSLLLAFLLFTFYFNNKQSAYSETYATQNTTYNRDSSQKPFILGTFPQDSREKTKERFKALIEYLSEKLGRRVVLSISLDYNQLAIDLAKGNVDFASISASTYIAKLEQFPKIKYLATAIDKKTGKAFYYGYIIVRKDSNIKRYSQLRGKYFAFVDEGSGSGYKFPIALMISRWGIDPKLFFKKTLFMGSHPNVINAVFKKQCQAGATWDFAYDEAVKKIGNDPFHILLKTPAIPLDTFVASPFLSKVFTNKLINILTAINSSTTTKSGVKVTENYYFSGYEKRNPSEYNIIKETVKILDTWKAKWNRRQ